MELLVGIEPNEDLQEAVAEKRFRKDLLYRFQDFTITVPALHLSLIHIFFMVYIYTFAVKNTIRSVFFRDMAEQG